MKDPRETARKSGLVHVDSAIEAARHVGLPLWAAFALLDKESGGRNVYGNDSGGVFAGKGAVNASNFFQFLVRVMNGEQSNGVGPTQITYAGVVNHGARDGGYFRVMAEQGLRPWVPIDNMKFGFGLLRDMREKNGSWRAAGMQYNGSSAYGEDFVRLCNLWRKRLGLLLAVLLWGIVAFLWRWLG